MTAINSKPLFTITDFIKFAGFAFTGLMFFFNLRDEIRENKIVNNADKVIINYRITTIEDFLKINNKPSIGVAILPQVPERKNEDE